MQVTRFIYADKAKGVKCLLFSPQYIEHKISKSNEIPIRMNEQKNILERLAEVIHPFKAGLITMFSPVFSPLEAYYPVNCLFSSVKECSGFCRFLFWVLFICRFLPNFVPQMSPKE